MVADVDDFLPLELVFNPNWWCRTAGISFEQPFYFDGPPASPTM